MTESEKYATPRSVRANCIGTMKSLIQKLGKVEEKKLKQYILRTFNIRPETFDRYIKDLTIAGLIKVNSKNIVWVEEEIDFTPKEKKKKRRVSERK